MDRLDNTFLWIEICKERKRRLDKMMLAYERDPSSHLLDEIKCKNEALIFLLEYARERYGVLDEEFSHVFMIEHEPPQNPIENQAHEEYMDEKEQEPPHESIKEDDFDEYLDSESI
jgi:hypothetical protein